MLPLFVIALYHCMSICLYVLSCFLQFHHQRNLQVRRFKFHLPDYYVALVRALLTLEGIALAADCHLMKKLGRLCTTSPKWVSGVVAMFFNVQKAQGCLLFSIWCWPVILKTHPLSSLSIKDERTIHSGGIDNLQAETHLFGFHTAENIQVDIRTWIRGIPSMVSMFGADVLSNIWSPHQVELVNEWKQWSSKKLQPGG